MTQSRTLVIASNRGPVSYHRVGDERVSRRGAGGLVTALLGLAATYQLTWVAAAITDEDRAVLRAADGAPFDETTRDGDEYACKLVDIDRNDYDRYYNVFSNPLLWFIQHGLWNRPYTPEISTASRGAWQAYQRVNDAFAEAVAVEAGTAIAVLVQDYQLYLVPAALRRLGVSAPLLHFTHIPWPGPDAWGVLTAEMREGILRGMLGADVIGFQTLRSVRAFLACVEEYLPGAVVDHIRPRVGLDEASVQVRAYPISIDPDTLLAFAAGPEVLREEEALLSERPERMVLRVDRTDPSKNVVRGFHAFARFLARHAEWHGRVRMLALLDPSRQEIPEYAEYVGAIQRAAREVNDRFTIGAWAPIELRIEENFAQAVAAYKHYDVLVVNAIVDGMNLIAKEAPLVNQRDGVLILSENTGAHEELGAHALSINPFDVEGTADAIAAALAMPVGQRRRRAQAMCAHVRANDVRAWIESQLADLDSIVGGVR